MKPRSSPLLTHRYSFSVIYCHLPFRRGSGRRNYDAADSIVRERTLRELYLRPFEMLVRQVGVGCIMTSFNKINGVFAGGNHDLCTRFLRDEWRFESVVVTDWGDMDLLLYHKK